MNLATLRNMTDEELVNVQSSSTNPWIIEAIERLMSLDKPEYIDDLESQLNEQSDQLEELERKLERDSMIMDDAKSLASSIEELFQ